MFQKTKMKVLLIFWCCALTYVYGKLNAKDYLSQFGYYDEKAFDAGTLTAAIKKYQTSFGLSATGVLDTDTLKLMSTKRCGLSDRLDPTFADQAWQKRSLSYYYNNYTPDLSRSQVRDLTEKAFKFWSDVTPLQFSERQGGDIVLSFGSRTHHDGKRQCRHPFDGSSGVLAHAFFPPDGRLHFDEDERYTTKSSSGTNYLWVATHELGHILGLEHDTKNRNAVMYPYYRPYNPNGMQLHSNDVARIQQLYGRGGGTNPATTTTKRPTIRSTATPTTCNDIFDCSRYVTYCSSNDSFWYDYVRKYCRKTCRFCNCKDRTTTASCQQYQSRCRDYSTAWTDYMKRNCAYTCSHC